MPEPDRREHLRGPGARKQVSTRVKGGIFAAAPRFAIPNPEYTMSLPRIQVLSGAFDTLRHAMETYFGRSDRDNVSGEAALAIMHSTVVNMCTAQGHP